MVHELYTKDVGNVNNYLVLRVVHTGGRNIALDTSNFLPFACESNVLIGTNLDQEDNLFTYPQGFPRGGRLQLTDECALINRKMHLPRIRDAYL